MQPPSQADPGFPPKKKSRFKSRRQVCVFILTDMPRFLNRDGNLWGSKIWRPSLFLLTPPPSAKYQQTPSLPPLPPLISTDWHSLQIVTWKMCWTLQLWSLTCIWSTYHQSLLNHNKITVKLRKLWMAENSQECWLCSDQSQWSSGHASKPQTSYYCCLRFGFLTLYWLSLHNTVTLVTFHEYFCCSRYCEFHSNNLCQWWNSCKNAQKLYYESKTFLDFEETE